MDSGTVLVRFGALGDVVLLGAVTRALPGPVTVVTQPRYAEVARRLRGVDQVLDPHQSAGVPGRWFDLQRSLRSVWLAPRATRVRKHSVRRRVGWLSPRPDVPTLYATACGVAVQPHPWIETAAAYRDTLALIPGAAWGPKRAPTGLLTVAGRRWPGPVVVLGGPGEAPLVQAVLAGVPGATSVVESGFVDTLWWLERTAVAVGGDSGLLHLAGASGAKVVAVFGPTSPRDGFAVHPGEVVQRSEPCRPCGLHRVPSCARGDLACMQLGPQQVVEAVARCAG